MYINNFVQRQEGTSNILLNGAHAQRRAGAHECLQVCVAPPRDSNYFAHSLCRAPIYRRVLRALWLGFPNCWSIASFHIWVTKIKATLISKNHASKTCCFRKLLRQNMFGFGNYCVKKYYGFKVRNCANWLLFAFSRLYKSWYTCKYKNIQGMRQLCQQCQQHTACFNNVKYAAEIRALRR